MLLTPSIATSWGSTPAERAVALPCDRHLSGTCDAYHRAITIEAPAATTFRWLCQLRVAPYSYDWLDNFGRRSPQELVPDLDDLALGQRFMTVFDLVDFERDRHITLRLRRGRSSVGDLVVTYAALPLAERRCRLLVRLLVRRSSVWPVALVRRVLLPWGDLVMMRRQLLNLRRLAEATARADAQRGGD